MSKKNQVKNTESVTVVKSHKLANIAVCIVAAIAALIIIAVVVMCAVSVDPLDGLKKPVRYEFYNTGSSVSEWTDERAQNKVEAALSDMDFSVMSAVLQWNWDYSYNFVRNANGDKIKMSAADVAGVTTDADTFMIEYVYAPANITGGEIDYSTAQQLTVDGETIYFDRVKVLITNTDGNVGEMYLYPYIYDRVNNTVADDGVTYADYTITAVKVRANTTNAYAALTELAQELKND